MPKSQLTNTPQVDAVDSDRLQLLKSRLSIAKSWAKKPHAAWKQWIAEYNIEDFADTDEVRDKVRIGYVFRKVESDLPAIFDDQPDLFIKGRKGRTKEIEPLIQGLYDFLWDSQHLDEKIEDVGLYFQLLGMGFIKSPYVTKTRTITEVQPVPVLDEMGQEVIDPATGAPMTQEQVMSYEAPILDQPMATVPDPFKVYFSPETKFGPVLDAEHCPYYFEEHTMTVEEVEARFGKKVDADEVLKLDDDEANEEITDAQNKGLDSVKSDTKRVTVYEYYGVLPKDESKGIKGAGPWAYDKEYHIFFTRKTELLAEECPYEVKPLFAVGNYGLANKFWRFGDAKHLMPLVQELQMYRSQILNHTRKMANPKPLIPSTSNVDAQQFRNPRVGEPVLYDGPQAPSYLSPASLGQEVATGVELVRTDLEKTSGSFDLAAGGGQSQVKTPRGIAVYAEAADKNIRRKRKKIARLIREIISFQFQEIAKAWKPEDGKTISIISDDGNPEAVEVTGEVLEVLGGVNQFYNLDIEIESLSVNRIQMRQDGMQLLDLARENPDIFNRAEIAKWLLQNGFNMRDGDRFLANEAQQLQALIAKNPDLAAQILSAMASGQIPALPGGQMGEAPAAQGQVLPPQVPESGMAPLPSIGEAQ